MDASICIKLEDPRQTETKRRELYEYKSKLKKLQFLSECDELTIDILKKKIKTFDLEIQKKDREIQEASDNLAANERLAISKSEEIENIKKDKSMDTNKLKVKEAELEQLSNAYK